jgi:hypothetical protein
MILVTALPIRPNPLIATFVAIRKSPFLDTLNEVFCLFTLFHNKRESYFIYNLPPCQEFIANN